MDLVGPCWVFWFRTHMNSTCTWWVNRGSPPVFILCIRALSNFRYLAQLHLIDDHSLSDISDALALFHQHKQAILNAGARVRAENNPLDHFFIPRLELLIMIQMPADLQCVLAVVGVLRGNLDHIDMGTLRGIHRPLNRGPRPAGTCDNTVEKRQLFNL